MYAYVCGDAYVVGLMRRSMLAHTITQFADTEVAAVKPCHGPHGAAADLPTLWHGPSLLAALDIHNMGKRPIYSTQYGPLKCPSCRQST